jgi:hypothetical protein
MVKSIAINVEPVMPQIAAGMEHKTNKAANKPIHHEYCIPVLGTLLYARHIWACGIVDIFPNIQVLLHIAYEKL